MAREWLKRGAALLIDLILPWLAGLIVARSLHPYSLDQLKASILGHFATYTPSDFGGTVWFYWWFHEAVSQGQTWLFTDAVCAPTGVSMGNNFPQWIDAALAYPFFEAFDFPLSMNLFSLSIPIMGAAAAYYALRALFKSRLLCLTLALIYGFNPYSYYELSRGRPVTAIIIVIPLFIGAWTMALRARGLWAGLWMLLAGAAGALSVYYYVVFAMLNATFAGITALYRTLRPFEGLSRLRAPLATLIVATLGILFSMGYLHQIIVLQPRLPGRPVYTAETLKTQWIRPFWDPQLWRDLKTAGWGPESIHKRRGGDAAPTPQTDWVLKTQSLSLPYYALYRERNFGGRPPEPYIPWLLSAMALAMGLLGGRRGLSWLGGGVGFLSLTLGPYICLETQAPYMNPLRISGHLIPGPLHLLYKALPEATHFFWPYRAYPMALFCLVCAIGAGLTAATQRWDKHGPAWVSQGAMGLIGLLFLHGYFGILKDARSNENRAVPLETLSPFLVDLREQKDAGLIELPLGAGRLVAEFQLVHGQARGDSHQDFLGAIAEQAVPPPECFDLPLLQGLWALGVLREPEPDLETLLNRPGAPPPPPKRPEAPPQIPGQPESYLYSPSLSRGAFQDAIDHNLVYLIVHHQTYSALERMRLFIDSNEVVAELTQLIGEPTYTDTQLSAWDLRAIDLSLIPEGEPTLDLPRFGGQSPLRTSPEPLAPAQPSSTSSSPPPSDPHSATPIP